MKTLTFFSFLAATALLFSSPVSAQTGNPSAGPDGFIVVKGVIYSVRQGQASILPDSLRWTGTATGVPGFPRAIQALQPGLMLTTEGKVVFAPRDLVFARNAVGTVAPVNDVDNSTDNSTTRATDNSTDNSTTRATDNSADSRTTRSTDNTTDNRTTRATDNRTDNSVTNGSPR